MKRLRSAFNVEPILLSERDPALAEKLERFASIIKSEGLPFEFSDFLYLDLDRDNLGWIVYGGEEPIDSWSADDLAKQITKVEKDSGELYIRKTYHLAADNQDQSPLSPSLLTLNDTELVLWLVREGIRPYLKSAAHPEMLSLFIRKVAEQVLFTEKGPSSPELKDFNYDTLDRIVWSSLALDLQQQITELRGSTASFEEESYLIKRRKIIQDWSNDYKFYYSDRFVTNSYLDFADQNFSDAEILNWDTSAVFWPAYSEKLKDLNQDLSAYFDFIF